MNIRILQIVLLVLVSICVETSIAVSAAYRTAIFHPDIKTLQVVVDDNPLLPPVIGLNDESQLVVEFDELTYVNSQFYYKIIHCDADWRQSALSSMEYIDGLDGNVITDYEYSVNTTTNYIHYKLSLPNEDVRLTRSGNYAMLIARDNDFDNSLVAVACFMVVEPLAALSATSSGTTLKEINGAYQQLAVEAEVGEVGATSVMTDFRLVAMQNGRPDTRRTIVTPTFLKGSNLEYGNVADLVFEAGNQYRSIDFSSRYTYGAGIDHIEFADSAYHVILMPRASRAGEREVYGSNAFGGFVVNVQGSDYDDTEADYMWVHFIYPAEVPYLEGPLYLLGDMTYNLIDDASLMRYDMAAQCYSASLLLKQGGYNFVYVIPDRSGGALSVSLTEGSMWQSNNRYDLYLYFRPFGARYDRLVGFLSFSTL